MKILCCLLLCILGSACLAQTPEKDMPNIPPTGYVKPEPTQEIVLKARNINGRVMGQVGSSFFNSEITRMPVRNINQIAGLSVGVLVRPGETPIMGGAPGGTAYFVDGIRVRAGALGIAGYNW